MSLSLGTSWRWNLVTFVLILLVLIHPYIDIVNALQLFVGFNKLTHEASLHFLLSGQYGLCFGYCFSDPLPLRSHKGQVTFLEPFPGVPTHLDYTQKLAESILALKLSVTTYFHWVTTTKSQEYAGTFSCKLFVSKLCTYILYLLIQICSLITKFSKTAFTHLWHTNYFHFKAILIYSYEWFAISVMD